MREPDFFLLPDGDPTALRLGPRLASWNAAGHADQQRLVEYLADAAALLGPSLRAQSAPLALRLDVGLPTSVPLLNEHDLDNYVFPLATYFDRAGTSFASVWSTKQHREWSFVRACTAIRSAVVEADFTATVHTTASTTSTAYKRQIHDQLADANELAPGPISLELAFVVGPRRNWLNLWKPTIDALERLLGRTRRDRDWHPREGRITQLGLHCTVDDTLGNEVLIALAASSFTDKLPS